MCGAICVVFRCFFSVLVKIFMKSSHNNNSELQTRLTVRKPTSLDPIFIVARHYSRMQRKTELGDIPTTRRNDGLSESGSLSHLSADRNVTVSAEVWMANTAFPVRIRQELMGQERRHLEAQLFPDSYFLSSSDRDAGNELFRNDPRTTAESDITNGFRLTYPQLYSSSRRNSQQAQSPPDTIRVNHPLSSAARPHILSSNSSNIPPTTTFYRCGGSGFIPTTMSSLGTTASQPISYANYHPAFEEEMVPPVSREREELIYTVAFKTCSKDYINGAHASFANIRLGSYVIVSVGERGEDFGHVTHVYSMTQYVQERLNLPQTAQVNITRYAAGRILRLASDRECHLFAMKTAEEQEVLQYARHLVDNVHRLGTIRLLEAEFQFDRHRLTLHYEAATRIDFRLLVRDLFTAYGARVWMERVHIEQMPSPIMLAAAAASSSSSSVGIRTSQQQHASLQLQQQQSRWGPEQHEHARTRQGYGGEHMQQQQQQQHTQNTYYPQHQQYPPLRI